MKRNISFLLIFNLFYSSAAWAQSKLSVGIVVSPLTRHITTQSVIPLIDASGNLFPVNTHYAQMGSGYALGLMAQYQLTLHWSVSAGIWQNRTHLGTPSITTNPDLTTMPNQPQISGLSYTYRAYQAPISVNYRSSLKRLSPYFSAGGQFSFPYTGIFPDGDKLKSPNQRLHFYPTLGVGVSYWLTQSVTLLAQPTFTYILPKGTYSSYSNYQLSFQLQALYRFK